MQRREENGNLIISQKRDFPALPKRRGLTQGGEGQLLVTHMVSFSFSIASSCFLRTLITSFETVPSSLARARSSLNSAVSLSSKNRFGDATVVEVDEA